MAKEDTNKLPITFRISPEIRARLTTIAKRDKRTVSSLIDEAMQAKYGDISNDQDVISKENIEHVLRVMDAIGKSISLPLFLSLVQNQREE